MTAVGNVPCNGCRACCLHDMIPLMPERGDLIWTYKHEVVATATGPKAVLQCGETGGCIYLGRDGCTIHDRAPAICRAFDCRELFRSKTRAERLMLAKSGVVSNEVFSAQTDQNVGPAAMMGGSAKVGRRPATRSSSVVISYNHLRRTAGSLITVWLQVRVLPGPPHR
jgi:Putative zinc- or iron-chelating domain